jgi:hypothetical protein
MYVVSELLKTFASEPAADASMGPILSSLLTTSCQSLPTLKVRVQHLLILSRACLHKLI